MRGEPRRGSLRHWDQQGPGPLVLDPYTPKEVPARAGTPFGVSKTVSRVLYLTVIYLDVPLPARSSHPGSGRASLGGRTPCSHTGVAPDRVYSIGQSPADG